MRHLLTPVQFVFLQLLNVVFTEILQLKTLKGLALHDILTEVHLLIHRGEATAKKCKKYSISNFSKGKENILFKTWSCFKQNKSFLIRAIA